MVDTNNWIDSEVKGIDPELFEGYTTSLESTARYWVLNVLEEFDSLPDREGALRFIESFTRPTDTGLEFDTDRLLTRHEQLAEMASVVINGLDNLGEEASLEEIELV
jgi:hypothetical protein